jgi:hypothetical protein
MKIKHETLTCEALKRRFSRINPKPQYQRTPVWNKEKRQLLVDSILRGYDLPKFYLRELEVEQPPFAYEVVDGQQRLLAIIDFLEDKFALGDRLDPPLHLCSRKKCSELDPEPFQDLLMGAQLQFSIIYEAEELEVRDLFLRLQNGVPLNPAEKRNAMPGGMRDFIVTLEELGTLYGVSVSAKRYGHHDLLAHIVAIELASGPTDVKASDLKKMYENENNFTDDSTVAKRVKKNLNYMKRILKDQVPEMDIKWGFVDLYLLVSSFQGKYVIKDREPEFRDFYIGFEQKRRKVDDKAKLLKGDYSDIDLFNYLEAFEREGAKKAHIAARHDIYVKGFLADYPDLVALDDTRAFTADERLVLWRQAEGICKNCNHKVKFAECDADHIEPFSEGGKTTLLNGQMLCKPCNQTKGAT